MTLRATVYLDPAVDSAIMAELERMSFRRRAGRLVELLRIGAETSLRQRDGTLRGGLVRCRRARIATTERMRVGIRLSGPADAAVMQLLAEASNRRSERLRQLARCGLEREAFWLQGAQREAVATLPLAAPLSVLPPAHLAPPANGCPLEGRALSGPATKPARPAPSRKVRPAATVNPWVMMAGLGALGQVAPAEDEA
jgi:hypothetical protein